MQLRSIDRMMEDENVISVSSELFTHSNGGCRLRDLLSFDGERNESHKLGWSRSTNLVKDVPGSHLKIILLFCHRASSTV